jgi:signal transduction histidine kinase
MQLPAHVAVYQGPDHVYQFVNPAYQRVFPHRSFVGRPFHEATPESTELGVVALFDHVYQTGEPYYGHELEGWFDFQGTGQLEQFYFDLSLHPLRDAQGRLDGVLDFSYDVTEQVRSRQQAQQLNQELEARVQQRTREVHEQQADLRRLFAQAPMAIVVLRGPQFIIEQVNEAAEAIWGRTAAQVLERPHFEAVPDAAGQGFEELLAGILETGEAAVLHEVPVQLNRGHLGLPDQGYYSIIFKPLRDEHKRVTRIAIMWTEATDQVVARQQVLDLNQELAAINEELHATNEELHASNTQLTRTNVDLDTFVYTASHDLKAPITNIEGIVLALRDTLPADVRQDELVSHLLDLLNQTVARFQGTINQLTDISRLQLAHTGPAEPVTLAPVVEAVRLDLAPAIAAAGTELTVAVTPELVVSFSPANLRSIVYNLLSNALKYRDLERPSRVQLYAAQTGPRITLTVQDNGLGMSEVQQRQLFGLFQRLHTHVEGTGVGLYITKRLVENAGGTITVASQPHVGTTFTVTFLV